MTTKKDIVDRLLTRPNDSPMHAEHLMDEAAAEIVALRAALDDIAENRMPEHRPDGSRWWFNGGEGFVEWATERARQALRRSNDDGN